MFLPSPALPKAWRSTVRYASFEGRPSPCAVRPAGIARLVHADLGVGRDTIDVGHQWDHVGAVGVGGVDHEREPNPLGGPARISFQVEPSSSLR